MEPAVIYSKRGTANLRKALEHILSYTRDAQEYAIEVGRNINELNHLAETPMLGNPMPDGEDDEQYWLILDKRYRVYYKRLDATHIVVGMFLSTKAKPVTSDEVKRSFGRHR